MLATKNSYKQKRSNVTGEIVNLAYGINIDSLNDEISKIARDLIRDGFGVLLAGINHPIVQVLSKYLESNQPKNGIKIIGYQQNSNLPDAAFIYGCAIHSMDFEPMFLPPTHAVSPVLAPLIAIAQSKKIDGKTFLKAFIAGIQFEAGLRIAAKLSDIEAAENKNHFPFEKKGFHPPGTVGTLGSALASSIALGLTQEQCCMAIGYAASKSSGLSGNIGTMTKATHCGNAARGGLEAALLTSFGLTSSKNIIETGSGWAEAFGGDNFNFQVLLTGMEELSCFHDPGFAFKKWPSHTAMQIAIQAALQVHKGNHSNGDINVSVPIFNYCDRPNPIDSNEARFSFQYNIAVSLIDGYVNSESFTDEKLSSPKIQDYLKRIKLKLDPDIPRDFGEMYVIIQTESQDPISCDSWPGHWKTPMTEDELSAKFSSCCRPMLDEKDTKEVEKHLLRIHKYESLDSIIDILNTI